MLRILMLAYNAAAVTRTAVEAALVTMPAGCDLCLLDNGSNPDESALLAECVGPDDGRVRLLRSEFNLGFAGGMNRLIMQALADPKVSSVLLLNNDALLQPGALAAMLSTQQAGPPECMVAARLMRAEDPAAVDSLGIALYRSGLASNRKREDERLLGPTGGCMLLTRRLLEDLHVRHGQWFDEAFFCYAEDTDLVMRARWLGYDSVFSGDALVLHHGSLSSGGADNEFVLYHGIRNSIWALAKNAPATWLWLHLPWLLAAHAGIWLRNLRKGRGATLWRLYRDAVRGLPAMWRQRAVIRRGRRVSPRTFRSWVEPRLYDRGYLRMALRELLRPARRR